MTTPFICVKDVTKKYANHLALDNVSILVPKQSIYGLLGPNGAGKTSLIRILNQITAPDSGSVLFDGESLSQKHISHIGYLPEERGLYKKMKVGEQAVYLAQLKGVNKHEAQKKLKQWFKKFEILGWWNRKVEELSKGMQQKIQFIVTIVHNPDLLIFDEPFSGFDPINVNLLKEEILSLRDKGATVIFSTHNMASVEEICDHIALINNGKKVLEGSVMAIKQQFRTHKYEVFIHRNETADLTTEGYEILEREQVVDGSERWVLRSAIQDNNELLHLLLKAGHLISFREILPSMNEIFIQQVSKSKHA
ncbi:MAG: ATP-binding cassette domain-containing protein [Lentimicrobiaceae bacterium]|jgi:ABC-2 type transport system ATP-binding protein|nr:ATP-binding cassette domain-containing protein [Lentimicrobiaceae bacterium]